MMPGWFCSGKCWMLRSFFRFILAATWSRFRLNCNRESRLDRTSASCKSLQSEKCRTHVSACLPAHAHTEMHAAETFKAPVLCVALRSEVRMPSTCAPLTVALWVAAGVRTHVRYLGRDATEAWVEIHTPETLERILCRKQRLMNGPPCLGCTAESEN